MRKSTLGLIAVVLFCVAPMIACAAGGGGGQGGACTGGGNDCHAGNGGNGGNGGSITVDPSASVNASPK
jgi:hypothetical protein